MWRCILNLRALRFFLIVYAICAGIFPLRAAAQFTQVTGTITDPNGIPYAFGTILGVLNFSGGTPKLSNGTPYLIPTQATTLDITGSFSVRLADNTQLTPGGSTWNFTICSAGGTIQPAGGKGPVCFIVGPLTISGTTQNITSSIAGLVQPLSFVPVSQLGNSVLISQLPPASSSAGVQRWIRDGTNSADCSTGGGANQNVCWSNGVIWQSLSGVAGGGTSLPGIVSATNPNTGNDPNDRRMVDFTCTTDSTTSTPAFSDENCFQIVENVSNGQALFGGGTSAKKTYIPLAVTGNYQGSGQRFAYAHTVNCYGGESDCADGQYTVNFASVPINGDEGESVRQVSYLQQQNHLNLSSVVSKTATTCNTTFTQSVTASVNVQTFTVASTTGCTVNDWIVLGQELPTGNPNESLMQITAVGVGNLSGQVTGNYSNGTTITPATVLTTNGDAFPWGQGRVLVNLTTTPVTAGTVNNISGAAFGGNGTSWSNGMVGGNSTVIGCVTLTNDQYTGTPFNGSAGTESGPLNSWFRIVSVSSATSLAILSFSTAGDASYHGKGFGAGGYTIRPCAKVLKISSDSKTVYLENNSFSWNANDSIEETIGSYPDVSAYEDVDSVYTTAGTLRRHLYISNRGARTITTGIEITGNMATGGNADTIPWATGISVSTSGTGVIIDNTQTGAAYDAIAETGNTQSLNPCYALSGVNLASVPAIGAGFLPAGLCANGTVAQFFLNFGSSTPARINFPNLIANGGQLTAGVTYDSPTVLKANPTLTFTSIAAQTCQEQTVTVSNSTTSMLASASPQADVGANLSYSGARVSSAGIISVKLCNPTTGAITPNAVVWNVAAMVL